MVQLVSFYSFVDMVTERRRCLGRRSGVGVIAVHSVVQPS